MRKAKRGMALITAIAVLALMLILFGGLAMIYSSQVSRNKLEHEQSQAMLLAQSYTEMLNHVLESSMKLMLISGRHLVISTVGKLKSRQSLIIQSAMMILQSPQREIVGRQTVILERELLKLR